MTAIASNYSTTDAAATFTSGDTLTLSFGDYLTSTVEDALLLKGTDQAYDVTIDGTLTANAVDGWAGIYLASSNAATITVGETGVIHGSAGVYLNGDATVINNGTMAATTSAGIAGMSGIYSISNTGTISSETSYGIYVYDTGVATIDNSGLITALDPDGASIWSRGNSIDTITNTGTIEGRIWLNGGDDIVHNEAGMIEGTVELGDGANQFYGGLTSVTVNGGAGVDSIFGGKGDDVINGGGATGAPYYQVLVGGDGNDHIIGGGDLDWISGGNGDDVIEDAGNSNNANFQTLDGGDGNDQITGGANYDIIYGGRGNDTMAGGAGGDDYYVDSKRDVVIETAAEGDDKDWIFASVSYTLRADADIEAIYATGTTGLEPINLTGNALKGQTIQGNSGNNRLDGGGDDGFADTLAGFEGDDTYVLGGETLDTVSDKSGIDTITSTISRNLGDFADIENLVLLGSADCNGTGNKLDNTLTGNAGNNVLNGGAGADTLIGGGGDDTYIVGPNVDHVVESKGPAGGNADLVRFTGNPRQTYTLGANLENLQLLGVAATNGNGNGGNNSLTGNGADNRLDGGAGMDMLKGGAGYDTFVFDTALKIANVDRIVDFNSRDDTIALENKVFSGLGTGTLANKDFKLIANSHATHGVDSSDRILYDMAHGDVYFDRDGSGSHYSRVLFAHLADNTNLHNTDFQIV